MTRKALPADRSELQGLGPKSRVMLAKIGISSLGQLRRIGAVAAYVRAKRANKTATLNLLYALQAAIDGCDWREVQQRRKLELLSAVEEYARSHSAPEKSRGKPSLELGDLRNIGTAMLSDFKLLGIDSVQELSRHDADELYAHIQKLTRARHDPCVWDTYAAAIHQAKTGEALAWWEFTKVRKARARDAR